MRNFLAISIAAGLVLGGLATATAEGAAPCTCRAPGHIYNLGDEACLQTPQGPRRATCIMTLNVTSWDVSKAPCSISRLEKTGGMVG